MEDTLISMGVAALLQMLKSGKKAKQWRKAMLKVFGAIAATYKLDQDFHDAAEKGLNS
jgi:hypothetical protein